MPGSIDTAAAAAAADAVLLNTAVCSRSAAACDSALPCATLGTVSALRALQVSAFLMQCVLGACHHPLACRMPALHMSGAPPAAHQQSASCLLAPCQLRSCRSPVALPALTGVLLQTRRGPLPAISACSCSGDARFDSGLVPLPGASCAPTCSRCSLLEQLVTCMLVRSHGIVVLVLVLGCRNYPTSWIMDRSGSRINCS